MKVSKIFLSFLLFLSLYSIKGQSDNYFFYHGFEKWEGSLNLGVNSFYGDINDNTNKIFPATPFQSSFYKDRNFVLGGYFGKRVTPFWTAALEFKVAHVSAHDKYDKLAFFSRWNNEIVISHTIDILSVCNVETDWAVYPKIGFGIYGFQSKMWSTTTGEVLGAYPSFNSLIEATGYHYCFAIPFGIGGSYRILPELRVYFETGATWVSSDYLDALPSAKRGFEGVWNTIIGVSYQFDFPRAGGNPRFTNGNKALEDDGINDKYKRRRNRSNLGTGKPRYSKSSAMKKH